jgi:hypothetical protein
MERREFLRNTALTGAGIALAGSAGWPDPALASASCLFGAHALPRGSQATQKESTLALEAEIGRKLGVFRRYSYWDEPPPDQTHLWAAQGGRIPYISWHAYTRNRTYIPWASIARGTHDAYIRSVGKGLASFGHPVFFNFHHEPENDPKNGSPSEFKAAFEHVRRIFDAQGAKNLTWICTLMGTTYRGRNGGAGTWLPPSSYYTYVGSDGYNRWPRISQPPWRSFAEIFGAAHTKSVQLGKHLFVGEYGCVEQVTPSHPSGDPQAKADWFKGAAATTKTWGNVVALSYSHAVATFSGKLMPYWADSSAVSLNAFKGVGLSSYFS